MYFIDTFKPMIFSKCKTLKPAKRCVLVDELENERAQAQPSAKTLAASGGRVWDEFWNDPGSPEDWPCASETFEVAVNSEGTLRVTLGIVLKLLQCLVLIWTKQGIVSSYNKFVENWPFHTICQVQTLPPKVTCLAPFSLSFISRCSMFSSCWALRFSV